MPRLTAHDFHPAVLKLFDHFVHGRISRSDFVDGAATYAVGAATGVTLLEALSPNFVEAIQVQPNDRRIVAGFVEYSSPKGLGQARGYLVTPKQGAAKLPGVLVVHENRGLNPHIEDIARRLALEGYVVLAPDALFTVGGYPDDEDKARELFSKLPRAKIMEDCVAAANHLKGLPECNGRFGATGFCFGGGAVNLIATRVPELAAGVPFYGGAPPLADVPQIKAAMLLHFAEHDDNINAQWPGYETALELAQIPYHMFRYPGTQHGFNNDTTPRYDVEAARLAWRRTLDFLSQHLK